MKLFVDDFRECPKGWTLARTNTEAIRYIWRGLVKEISLDYDIRHCSNKRCVEREETFAPVFYYLFLMQKEFRPTIRIHTGNAPKGQAWAMMLGIDYHGIFNPLDYEEKPS